MGIIAWLVLGLIAGWIASMIMGGGGYGIVGDIVVGIVGAFIGGWLGSLLLGVDVTGLDITSLILAVIGAIVLIAIYRAVAGPSRARSQPVVGLEGSQRRGLQARPGLSTEARCQSAALGCAGAGLLDIRSPLPRRSGRRLARFMQSNLPGCLMCGRACASSPLSAGLTSFAGPSALFPPDRLCRLTY